MFDDSWLRDVWNTRIAPVVTDAVVKGTGVEASHGGQQKVANTALYVLMQRSVVSGCPVAGSGMSDSIHPLKHEIG